MNLRRIARLHLPPAIAFTVLTGVHVGVAWAQDASADAGADATASTDAATDANSDSDGGTADNGGDCGGMDHASGAAFIGAGCC